MMRPHRLLLGLFVAATACDRSAEITARPVTPSAVLSPSAEGIASGVFIQSAPLGKPGMAFRTAFVNDPAYLWK